ncbi:MAG: prepilin-type N-terminal cleavage/methylation domain-containing protein [Rhodobacteraceae bacterium]|nr:prepilin-type N-terminal cleavage/methylation domain-containing protein [Paracoccaceae bacterium]
MPRERRGITLLEVILAMAILLISLAADRLRFSREDKIAQAVLDVCYEDHGNIDVPDLAGQVLTRLGYGDGTPGPTPRACSALTKAGFSVSVQRWPAGSTLPKA